MKLAAATVLLAPAVFGFAPQQIAFRSRSTLSASTEASTEKKVRYYIVQYLQAHSENPRIFSFR